MVIERSPGFRAITQWNVTSCPPVSISLRVSESSSSNPASRSARSFASGSKPAKNIGTPSQSCSTSSSVSLAPRESMNRPPGRSHDHTRANIGACSARGRWLKTKNATTASNAPDGNSIVVKSPWMNVGVREPLASERELPRREVDAGVAPAVGERGDTVPGPHPSSSTAASPGSRWSTSSRNHSRTPGPCDVVHSKYREPSRSYPSSIDPFRIHRGSFRACRRL